MTSPTLEPMLTPTAPGHFAPFMGMLFGTKPELFEALASDKPIPKSLECPDCGLQHIDAGEWATPEKAHKTHLCLACGKLWRPFPFPTVGVPPSEYLSTGEGT